MSSTEQTRGGDPAERVMPQVEPTDGTTLTHVLEGYAEAGFAGGFSTAEGTTLECHACSTRTHAGRVRMSSLRRLEGASDPDDMFAVVALTCPSCGTKGTLILGYGPTAPAEDSDVLHALQDFRDDAQLPGNSAPGETVGDMPDATAAPDAGAGDPGATS